MSSVAMREGVIMRTPHHRQRPTVQWEPQERRQYTPTPPMPPRPLNRTTSWQNLLRLCCGWCTLRARRDGLVATIAAGGDQDNGGQGDGDRGNGGAAVRVQSLPAGLSSMICHPRRNCSQVPTKSRRHGGASISQALSAEEPPRQRQLWHRLAGRGRAAQGRGVRHEADLHRHAGAG